MNGPGPGTSGHARYDDDGPHPGVGILQVGAGVTLDAQHAVQSNTCREPESWTSAYFTAPMPAPGPPPLARHLTGPAGRSAMAAQPCHPFVKEIDQFHRDSPDRVRSIL